MENVVQGARSRKPPTRLKKNVAMGRICPPPPGKSGWGGSSSKVGGFLCTEEATRLKLIASREVTGTDALLEQGGNGEAAVPKERAFLLFLRSSRQSKNSSVANDVLM